MKKAEKNVTVGMSTELYNTLKQLAEEDCRSVPSYIRLVLREHVEKKRRELPPPVAVIR
mgnify:FL=1